MYIARNENGVIVRWSEFQGDLTPDWIADDDPELLAVINPPPPPYVIPASLPWARMTEDEAELVQDAIDSSPVKTRNMINKATSFTFGADAFDRFMTILVATLNQARADQILAPQAPDETASVTQPEEA